MDETLALTLIVPCFNEANTITETVTEITQYMQQHFPTRGYELLLVNDGSEDNTESVLRRLAQSHSHVRVVSYPRNQGRGYALRQGFAASRGDIVITLDADLSYDVDHIGEMLQAFDGNPKTDAVIVSAYHKKGVVKGVPLKRAWLSRIANHILRSFFDSKISTITCVVRAYRGDVIRRLSLLESGKEIHLEILRKLNLVGANIQEIPGRLIWKKPKDGTKRRSNKLNVNRSARRHLNYALMIRPTLIFKLATIVLIAIGIYETAAIAYQTTHLYDSSFDTTFISNFWYALKSAYQHSPHSFFIAFGSLILGLQTLSLLVMLKASKLQQEEVIQHLLAVLSERKAG